MGPIKAVAMGFLVFALAYAYVCCLCWGLALGARDDVMSAAGLAVIALAFLFLIVLVIVLWYAVKETRPKYYEWKAWY